MAGEPGAPLHFPDVPKLELDQLIDQLVESAQGVKRTQGRLRSLLRAIETVNGDLALDVVLQRVVEAACDLTLAGYGALGVIGHDGHPEQLVYRGVDGDAADRTGRPPREEGLLRVPIHVRGDVFGTLYLADSAHGAFSAEDEELLAALSLAAGTAISNARLYHESQLQQQWLQASVEIGSQMLASTGEDPLRLIARRAIDVADADVVSVSLLNADRTRLTVEVAVGEGADELLGRSFGVEETLGGRVVRDDEPVLLADPTQEDGPPSHLGTITDIGPLMIVPLRGTGRPRGVLSVVRRRDRPAFSQTDLAMAAGFASHASIALELADSRVAEQRLVLLEDRDRIARDLHDHVIQDLFAVGLSLEGVAAQLAPDDSLGQRIRRGVESIDRTIRRIRTSIFQLRGNVVEAESGLRRGVLEVVTDLTPALGFAPHTTFGGVVDLDLDEDLVDDVLACVREALTNVAKHARASVAVVDLVMAGGEITVTVTDDGVGAEGASRSSGTANLRARAERRSGSFEMEPAPGGGTVVTWKAKLP